ncbi:MAG: cyclase family protein [Granulosicoccus sp.]|nr:cyclase family protein [Granulosicoccus sp.]
MKVHDLSMPIETGHLRWNVDIGKRGSFSDGDLFEVSWLHTTCHGFTHVDAPRHMVPGGPTLGDLSLDRVVGPASVLDLGSIKPDEAIDARRLAAAGAHIEAGEIILFKSCWYQQRDYHTEAFWREAPFLTRDAAEWLLAQNPTAVAFDFPQDWTIRCLLDGDVRPIEEHVTHDVLLRNNVTLIEYLIGTDKITTPKTFLCAQPLNLPDADGAPARVIAVEF